MKLKTKIFNFFRLFFRNRFFESILIPLTKNKNVHHFLAKVPANYYQYKKPTIRNVVIDGIRFQLDISDYLEWLLYFGIRAEPKDVLYELATNKKIIFDVGGNFGETALFMAKKASNDSIIYVFEPDAFCFNKLLKNISLNNFKNIKPFNFGFGSVQGYYFMSNFNIHNRGENKIHSNSQMKPNVQIIRMDDFFYNEKISSVDLIKIDVEGYEYHVLKGGEEIIKKHRPALFIEINDKNLQYQGSSLPDLLCFLEKYYSRLFRADNLQPVHSTMTFRNVHFDLVALP